MKKVFISIITLCTVGLFATGASAYEKDVWYIGFGIGGGQGWCDFIGSEESFNDVFDRIADNEGIDYNSTMAYTFNLGIGAIVTPEFHLGFEWSAIYQAADFSDNYSLTFQANNYFLVGSYYPMVNGFFVKGGVGFCSFIAQEEDFGYITDEHYSGYGALIGIGYDFSFGSNFNLGIHMDYTKQVYDDYDLEDASFLSIYVSFYWF